MNCNETLSKFPESLPICICQTTIAVGHELQFLCKACGNRQKFLETLNITLEGHNESIYELLTATQNRYYDIVLFLLEVNTYDVKIIERLVQIAVKNKDKRILDLISHFGVQYLTRRSSCPAINLKYVKICSQCDSVYRTAEIISCPFCKTFLNVYLLQSAADRYIL